MMQNIFQSVNLRITLADPPKYLMQTETEPNCQPLHTTFMNT